MRYSKHVLLIVLTFATTTAFQNCAPGFQAASSLGGASLSSELDLDSDEQNRLAGKTLYDQNCLSCHGQLDSSSKAGTSADAIQSAIRSVGQMQSLRLTDQEISLIELALSPKAVGALKYTCTDSSSRGLTSRAIRRMSSPEVANTLRFVLGDTVFGDEEIADQVSLMPSDSIVAEVDDYTDVPRAEILFALQKIAKRAVEITESSESARISLFGACAKAAPIADSCASAFISQMGAKIYRRPVRTAEVSALQKVFSDEGRGLKGLQSALFVLLQSPTLAMHIEEGEEAVGFRTRLTNYEIANRISYLTLASPPDAQLLKAADAGQLQTLSVVKTHVSRLLSAANSDARNRISSFMTYYSGLSSLEEPRASVGLAAGVSTNGLDTQMLRELSDFTDHVIWTKAGSFVDLMTSTDSFPRSDAMMKILGAKSKVGSDGKPVKSDMAHMGLLHRPAYLSSPSERTSPILRGVAVRREILCTKIPDPPAGDADEKLAELEALENNTNRARIDLLTGGPACIGCHALINPLGHLFENYNQLGQLRTEEIIYDDKGLVKKTWSIDTQVANPKLDPDEPSSTALSDSIALTKAIATGKTARACFVQKAFEYVRARHVDEKLDGCALREAEKKVQTGTLRDALIESIANEDIFWRSNQ